MSYLEFLWRYKLFVNKMCIFTVNDTWSLGAGNKTCHKIRPTLGLIPVTSESLDNLYLGRLYK